MLPGLVAARLGLSGIVLAAALAAAPAAPDISPTSRYGALHLQRPPGVMRGFVILFSRGDNWTLADQDAAETLAAEGALVAGVATGEYLGAIDADPEACHLMDGDAETLARQLQREAGAPRFLPPLLVGTGAGGLLAGRVLALAPPNTMAGAISIDPTTNAALTALPCGVGATTLNGAWDIGTTPSWPAPDAAAMAAARRAGLPATLHPLPAGGTDAERLRTLAAPYMAVAPAVGGDVSDLPLIELRASLSTDMLAIVIAGDGGWRDIDKSLAETLHRDGVSVVGLDSLRYFWRRRTPEQVAADLARIMRSYGTRWGARQVALIGYSFGADVLPFAYARLPAELRRKVALVSLLGLSTGADFEIRVAGWLGAPPSAQALPVAPEIARMPPRLVQCIYGAEDADSSACPALAGTGADVVRTAGGHHFGGDYEELARRILRAWRERIG